jgi:predicted ATPase
VSGKNKKQETADSVCQFGNNLLGPSNIDCPARAPCVLVRSGDKNMIRLIEALNYRCLHYVRRPLAPFHVLVGPNASGKTTFLDVIGFLGRLVSDGLEAAVSERTSNFDDLLFKRQGECFELAIEALIPDKQRQKLKSEFESIRYEISVGIEPGGAFGILQEKAWLKKTNVNGYSQSQRRLFPEEPTAPATIITGTAVKGWQRVLSKAKGGNDNFYVEVREPGGGKGWFPSIRLGPKKSALANLPEDESKFPVSTWLKGLLTQGVQMFVLNSLFIRKASPPRQGRGFKPDGSNLPWVIASMKEEAPERFADWIDHIRTALPDIKDIQIAVRDDDKHAYLLIHYEGGLVVPSWMASDGTLRLLALTLPAFLPHFLGVYLIEEPENGIHPSAVETVFQSLSSVYDAQILLATHSPVILSQAKAEQVLCFNKTKSGATDIILGSAHPKLKDWKGQPNLSVLFASGVLG